MRIGPRQTVATGASSPNAPVRGLERLRRAAHLPELPASIVPRALRLGVTALAGVIACLGSAPAPAVAQQGASATGIALVEGWRATVIEQGLARTDNHAGFGYAPRDFTAYEKGEVRRSLDAVRPLLRCDGQPLEFMYVLDKTYAAAAGINAMTFDFGHGIAFAGDIDTKSGGISATTLHELTHALLQFHDPTTCTTYADPYANPLVAEWGALTGWDRGAPSKPVTDYAAQSELEDMAESFRFYMQHRAALREQSPERAAFFEHVFERLGVDAPREIAESVPPAKDASGDWLRAALALATLVAAGVTIGRVWGKVHQAHDVSPQ